jgi:transketolase
MENKIKTGLREVMVQTLMRKVEEGKNIVVLVSDSTSTSKIAPFVEKYPDRLVNVGIAEQNLIGIAAGLSLGGFIPITANAAPFLVGRSNEHIKNDICYSNSNVKLVGLNAGVCYGSLASTHHSIDDISIMRGFGTIHIYAPSDPIEVEQIFNFAIDHTGPVYIRMDSDKFQNLHDSTYKFETGNVDKLVEGDDISIIATGSMVNQVFLASQMLKKNHINAEVLNISSIRPLNKKQIISSIVKTKNVVTVEEHSINGGIGSLVAEIIAENDISAKITRLGIADGEFAKAGPRSEIRAYHKLDMNGIMEAVAKLLVRTVKKDIDRYPRFVL